MKFYQGESQRLDQRKESRAVEKGLVIQQLVSEGVGIELPQYPRRSYCLHIYFYKLPQVAGSLYLHANNVEYECLNIPASRYFIIGEVHTKIVLEFINNKSDEFTAELQCMDGVNKYTL
jgi:hypothetical protein